jgi:predicted nucleic acid-binding protein
VAELGERVTVIDASLAAKWAIPEPGSDLALALARRWGKQRTRLIAPGLILPEVANAVYKRIVRGEIDLATAKQAVRIVLGFGIEICEEPGVPSRALELAHELRRPTVYDCYYLALAEFYRSELWTGDERLYNSVRARLPWVKWIGAYTGSL